MAKVGPFLLVSPLGKGGMGVVWRGRFQPQNLDVAVKIITRWSAGEHRYQEMFANEVRAMARLSHPHIVTVLDHGLLDADTAEEIGLAEGAPWLAMEYASGGSVDSHTVHSWPLLKEILVDLLDALAHAHARGLVHRDLKPENVLRCTHLDARPGLKLADFGIAHVLDHDDDAAAAAGAAMGTPEFMAPEQLLGWWRDFGPWTDLYSLGCVTYLLCNGTPPFEDELVAGLRRAHLYDTPRRVQPPFPIPDRFHAWLAGLLAKRPGDRFQCAADARYALQELKDPPGTPPPARPRIKRTRVGRRSGPTLVSPAMMETPVPLDAPLKERPAQAPPPAPMPLTWVRSRPEPSLRLTGAGLALHGLRTWPLVGREGEQGALWKALLEVYESGRPGLVVVRGAAGTGRTRLVGWLCERARELGAASALFLRLHADEAPPEALARMAATVVRASTREEWQVEERVAEFLEARGLQGTLDARAIARLVSGHDTGAADRHRALVGLVETLLHDRPVVFAVDDVHHALDLLSTVRGLFRDAGVRRRPVLFVVTCLDEALADLDGGEADLVALTRDLGGTRIELDRLAPAAHAALLERWMGLEGTLAAQLERQTAGNPSFTVELVQDWVARGVLVAGPEGFRVADRAPLSFPKDLHELWLGRVRAVLAGLPPAAVRFLELAAAMGTRVDEDRWAAVCDDTVGVGGFSKEGARIRARLVDALFEARLAEEVEEGWAFSTALVQAAVARLSREAGRWRGHHERLVALARKDAHGTRVEGWDRLGRHLQACGRLDESLEPLLRAARATTDIRYRLDVLGRVDLAMRRLETPTTDARWIRLRTLEAETHRVRGRLDAAVRLAGEALAAAEAAEWPELASGALVILGEAALTQGRLDEAEAHLQDLLARAAPDSADRARGLLGMGGVAMFREDWRGSRRIHREAAATFAALGETGRLADCLRNLGLSELQAAEWDRAESAFARARDAYVEIAHDVGVALCDYGHGHVARGRELYRRAEAVLTRSSARLRELGSAQALLPEVQLGLALLLRGRLHGGSVALARASEELAELGWAPLLGVAASGLALHAALVHDADALERALRTVESAGFAGIDVVDCLERAARAAPELSERVELALGRIH